MDDVATASQFTALAPHYDELMSNVPYASWVEYVLLLFSVVEHQPRRVLDCACGTGNVSFELAHHGLEVVGVDASQGMIQAAQAKSQSTPLPVRFVHADLTDFELNEKFDSATCLYDSFNYILEPEKLQQAFTRIAAHLTPGGIFVFDMNSEYAFQANLFTQKSTDPRKQLHYHWQARFDESTRICTVQMEFKRSNPSGKIETFYEVHRERAYSCSQVTAMLVHSGWQVLRVFDAYTLNRTHACSERWYFVARRI